MTEDTPKSTMAGRSRFIHLALRRLGLAKVEVCAEFSAGRAFRLAHLTPEEHREVYEFCQKELIAVGQLRPSAFRPKEGDAQRKNVIGILVQMGTCEMLERTWTFVRGDQPYLPEIEGFVEQYGPCRPKPFSEYDKKELSRLITAMENAARSERNRQMRIIHQDHQAKRNESSRAKK